ncbi:MAG: CDP-glucose 4,6-dehydratase [Alphaproteobacteria bacterium]|nr:CDP-glucose 4,6-dehydratase [Alphaproteobacteria bacterium]MCW5744213.1 CDP-glucose 4,6-dehydratase [Alphaproteobacteria bacterium]
MTPDGFFRGKRVLLTGHTGFKGAWLAIWLRELGARVCGVSLPPPTEPSIFERAGLGALIDSHICDIRDAPALDRIMRGFDPEIVLHLAAQPLVRTSYEAPVETFGTNVMGTVNLLESLRTLSGARVAVVVTSDKVYRNAEWVYPYREDDPLGGRDPYSASKAAAEIVTSAYRHSFFHDSKTAVATARAGNVIGGGDWSKDRLLPDAIRAWQSGAPLGVRHPGAHRPWQHVLDALHGYMLLVEALWRDPSLAGPWNFGPATHETTKVGDVLELARKVYGSGKIVAAKAEPKLHEAGKLMVESAKARERLGFAPRWGLEESVRRTMGWYQKLAQGEAALELCRADIAAFGAAR